MRYEIIKVCGMKYPENIKDVVNLDINWMGMIFYDKSPRCVGDDAIAALPYTDKVKKVGVFVDDTAQNIITAVERYGLDMIQMHGDESSIFIRNMRKTLDPEIKIIKAISVRTADDIARCMDYEDCVDYFLFDTKCDSKGGSGKTFDWEILKTYNGDVPFLISGGIGAEQLEALTDFYHPQCIGIDLNSRFEISPGMKDVSRLREFIANIRMINTNKNI